MFVNVHGKNKKFFVFTGFISLAINVTTSMDINQEVKYEYQSKKCFNFKYKLCWE